MTKETDKNHAAPRLPKQRPAKKLQRRTDKKLAETDAITATLQSGVP